MSRSNNHDDLLENIECHCKMGFIFPCEVHNDTKVNALSILIVTSIVLNLIDVILITASIVTDLFELCNLNTIYFNYQILASIYLVILFVTSLCSIKFVMILRRGSVYTYSNTVTWRVPINLKDCPKTDITSLSILLAQGLNLHMIYICCGIATVIINNCMNPLLITIICCETLSFVIHIIVAIVWFMNDKFNFTRINTPLLLFYTQLLYQIFALYEINQNIMIWFIPFMTLISMYGTIIFLNRNDKMKRATLIISVSSIIISSVVIGILFLIQDAFDMNTFNYLYFMILYHGLMILFNFSKLLLLCCYVTW